MFLEAQLSDIFSFKISRHPISLFTVPLHLSFSLTKLKYKNSLEKKSNYSNLQATLFPLKRQISHPFTSFISIPVTYSLQARNFDLLLGKLFLFKICKLSSLYFSPKLKFKRVLILTGFVLAFHTLG